MRAIEGAEKVREKLQKTPFIILVSRRCEGDQLALQISCFTVLWPWHYYNQPVLPVAYPLTNPLIFEDVDLIF